MTRPLLALAEFLPVQAPGRLRWGALRDYASLQPLTALPLADTEVLNLSHHAPIGIYIADGGVAQPLVSLFTHPALTRNRVFSPEGKWLPPYLPQALRALPFAPAENGQCLFSPALASQAGDAPFRAETEAREATPEFRAILEMVGRLFVGARRLSDAARLLLAADVLVPLRPLEESPGVRLLVADSARLEALGPAQAAGLTAMGMLPLELAAASLFSARFLAREVDAATQARRYSGRVTTAAGAGVSFEPLPPELQDDNYLLDTGGMFDIEAFLSATGRRS